MHENTRKTKISTGSYYGQNNSMYTADMLVKEQKKTGQIGHDGSDGLGSVDIIKRTGFKGTKMERIAIQHFYCYRHCDRFYDRRRCTLQMS